MFPIVINVSCQKTVNVKRKFNFSTSVSKTFKQIIELIMEKKLILACAEQVIVNFKKSKESMFSEFLTVGRLTLCQQL